MNARFSSRTATTTHHNKIPSPLWNRNNSESLYSINAAAKPATNPPKLHATLPAPEDAPVDEALAPEPVAVALAMLIKLLGTVMLLLGMRMLLLLTGMPVEAAPVTPALMDMVPVVEAAAVGVAVVVLMERVVLMLPEAVG